MKQIISFRKIKLKWKKRENLTFSKKVFCWQYKDSKWAFFEGSFL